MKKLSIALSALGLFTVGLWFFAIPGHMILDSIENSLNRDDILLRVEGFKKGLFYNFTAERILITGKESLGEGNTLLVIEDVHGSLSGRSLLKLDPEVGFSAAMGGGSLSGVVKLMRRDSIRVSGQGIRAQSIPALAFRGFSGEGILEFDVVIDEGSGDARFSVNPLKLDNLVTGNLYLPLEKFKNIKGIMTMLGRNVEIRSIIAEGDGITARIKGYSAGPDLDLTIELMVGSSFESAQVIEMMLRSFEVSPGYYKIKFKYRLPGIF